MTLPFAPSEVTLTAIKNHRETRSPFTGRSQTQLALNEWWLGTLRLDPIPDEQAAEWRTFILQQKGRLRTFRLGPHRPNAGPGGSPVVEGSGQLGNLLLTRGWNPNSPNRLLAGDHIEVDERLYLVTMAFGSDESGRAFIPIWPRLRGSPLDGAEVITDDPRGRFRLSRVRNPHTIEPGPLTSIQLEFVEAL